MLLSSRRWLCFAAYRTVCIVGGAAYDAQIGQLRRGAEIVVATPGRLGDCLRRTYAVLNQCAYVVLDEADRMIDLGFEPQVMDVLAAMPSTNMKPLEEENEAPRGDGDQQYRTTYMFSATMPPAVERIAKRYLRRPVTVTVGSAGRATDNVTQRVEWTDKKQKPNALLQALNTFQHEVEMQAASENDGFKIIVFVNNRVLHLFATVPPVVAQADLLTPSVLQQMLVFASTAVLVACCDACCWAVIRGTVACCHCYCSGGFWHHVHCLPKCLNVHGACSMLRPAVLAALD